MNAPSAHPLPPSHEEMDQARAALRVLAGAAGQHAVAIGAAPRGALTGWSAGAAARLPQGVVAMLRRALELTAEGHGVRVMAVHDELTTRQAAELLGVSRPHLVQLLKRQLIPCRLVGTHRRVRHGDLQAYIARRDAAERRPLKER